MGAMTELLRRNNNRATVPPYYRYYRGPVYYRKVPVNEYRCRSRARQNIVTMAGYLGTYIVLRYLIDYSPSMHHQ